MLETVREFGLERLAASGEEEAIRRLHAAWYTAMAENTWQGVDARADAEWLNQIEADHDNVRAALVWLDQIGDPEALLRLAGSLWPFWHRHSHRLEGRGWLDRALDSARSVGVPCEVRVRPCMGLPIWHGTGATTSARRRWPLNAWKSRESRATIEPRLGHCNCSPSWHWPRETMTEPCCALPRH